MVPCIERPQISPQRMSQKKNEFFFMSFQKIETQEVFLVVKIKKNLHTCPWTTALENRYTKSGGQVPRARASGLRFPGMCAYARVSVCHTYTHVRHVREGQRPQISGNPGFFEKKNFIFFCIFSRAKASEARFAGVSVHAPCHAMVHTLWYK